MSQNLDVFRADIARFIEPNVLGFYTTYDVIEIFAIRDGERTAHNVFSILVAEEYPQLPDTKAHYVGDRIRIPSLKGWFFGIRQSKLPVQALDSRLVRFAQTREWSISEELLNVGELVPIPPQFVAPDSTEGATLNGVLKNNFWSGSYIAELMDTDKTALSTLFEVPKRLQELSASVQTHFPIKLASLSDRLGNVVVQFPVTVLIAAVAKNRDTGEAMITIAWHPDASPRPLRAACEMQFDKVISTYASAIISGDQTSLATTDGAGMQRVIIWDDAKSIIVAATMPTGFINTVGLTMHVSDPEPRVFTLKDKYAKEHVMRVGLGDVQESQVKAPTEDRGEKWIHQRIFREETDRLIAERRFVQYKPIPGQQDSMHEKALEDVRLLLRRHGKHGAWLWDPYLGTEDLLKTLFYCPFKGAELCALSAGKRPQAVDTAESKAGEKGSAFAEEQRVALSAAKSNLRGLRLEFRMRYGQAGWNFHDRFLIFPKTDSGPLAWSLGASVNGLGRQHHILQRVDDAQLIADAFRELWEQLDQPQNLVWKVP